MQKKIISICTSAYNEKGNITEFYERVTKVMSSFEDYDYEIIIADNNSTDGTRDEIRLLAAKDKRLKAIFNIRNFGHLRSPHHALKQAKGEAIINLCSDLEDPPEIIRDFLLKWQQGNKVVLAIRRSSAEKGIYPFFRKLYYKTIKNMSETMQIGNFTGFGLYDRQVINMIFSLDDPLPYFRGLIPDLGYKWVEVLFDKPYRKRGITKGSLLIYFDLAMQGIVNSTRLPLRLATLFGITTACFSICIGTYYLIMKLFFWNNYQAGIAPIVIMLFFLFGILFGLLGIIGEYISLLVSYHVRRPLVIEEERINFD